jgi:glycosyltransferase involved in cell wall biosynthesis
MDARRAKVSVVVPVKNSQRTIRANVESLLDQDYDGDLEVILVGDRDDATWGPIADYISRGEVTAIEVQIESPARDANAKRNAGLTSATGDILALTDSDMVMPPDWVRKGVALVGSGWKCVGGEMQSADTGLWNSYIDTNPIASKTPRMDPPYVLTPENCGVGAFKMPITANTFLTREVLDGVGGFDADFVWSYEDYEFFEHVVQTGYPVLCTSELTGRHYHRQGLRKLVGEYGGSGRGCAQFVAKYPRSRFARKRIAQLALLTVSSVLLLAPYAWLALAVSFFVLALLSAAKSHHIGGLLFPTFTFVLGMAFALGLTYGLARLAFARRHLSEASDVSFGQAYWVDRHNEAA